MERRYYEKNLIDTAIIDGKEIIITGLSNFDTQFDTEIEVEPKKEVEKVNEPI